jgi:hypothetical protein
VNLRIRNGQRSIVKGKLKVKEKLNVIEVDVIEAELTDQVLICGICGKLLFVKVHFLNVFPYRFWKKVTHVFFFFDRLADHCG